MFKSVFLIMILFLGACSNIPKTIRNAPQADIQLSDVQTNFSAHLGKPVRWGGKVLNVKNNDNESTLQILSYPLTYSGRPDLSATPQGRFIVRTDEFLDPEFYTKDTELTVAGLLVDQSEYQVDKKSLNLPVLENQEIYRWHKYRQRPFGSYYGNYGWNYGYGYCPTPFYSSYRFGGFGYRGLYYSPYRYW